MVEHVFRGPRGRLHLPRWTKGCYYGRPASCCWLCWGRLFAATIRYGGGA